MPDRGRNDRSPRYFVLHIDAHEFQIGIDPYAGRTLIS
jgi:hypothetical protein